MTARRSPAEIIKVDEKWKGEVDSNFERDAIRLRALYDDQGRKTTLQHLSVLGMGDVENREPLQIGTVPRLVNMLSVLYEHPAFRVLARDEAPIDRADPAAVAFRRLSARMPLNLAWAQIDQLRNLLRQVVVVFAESKAHGGVVARVFEPYNTHRMPTAGAADVLDQDEAVAFCVTWAEQERERLYQTWQRQDDGTWRCWIQNHGGDLVGVQPYGDEGRAPFDGLPAVLVTDELLMGRAWLPIPQGRLAMALNINAVINDVQLLVKHEGHTMTIATSPDPASIPNEHGPDKLIRAGAETKYYKLSGDPKIEDSSRTTERMLAMLALSESLPVNAFSVDAMPLTGAQLMVAERDLIRRRRRQADIGRVVEALAYEKYTRVARAFAELKMQTVDPELDLICAFAQPSQYKDVSEMQDVSFRELSLGTKSMHEHYADMHGVSVEDAGVMRLVLDKLREEWPTPSSASELIAERVETTSASTSTTATPGQNPAALVRGPKPAVGRGGARKTPGAFNADMGTSSEGASVIDTLRGK